MPETDNNVDPNDAGESTSDPLISGLRAAYQSAPRAPGGNTENDDGDGGAEDDGLWGYMGTSFINSLNYIVNRLVYYALALYPIIIDSPRFCTRLLCFPPSRNAAWLCGFRKTNQRTMTRWLSMLEG